MAHRLRLPGRAIIASLTAALAAFLAATAIASEPAAAADSPPAWTLCANEGQTCTVTGTQQVRYGASGTFLYRTVTDSIACTNAAFGSDPVPWIVKRCEVGPSPAAIDAPWSASGTGASVTSDGTSGDPVLDYSVNGSSGAWKFSATAKFERRQPVTWRYKGYHAWYQVRVAIEKFVIRNGTEIITETLRSTGPVNCCAAPSGGFDYTGTTTFDLQPGDVYGFRISGSHFDSDRRLIGTLSLSIPVVLPPDVETTVARIKAGNSNSTTSGPTFPPRTRRATRSRWSS